MNDESYPESGHTLPQPAAPEIVRVQELPPGPKDDEPEKLPCIFGDKIIDHCPVRQALAKVKDNVSKEYSKYIKAPNAEAEALKQVLGPFLSGIENAMSGSAESHLSEFCRLCPYLYKFSMWRPKEE